MASKINVQEAIEMRENGASLQEIGDRYGVTRERVRQLIGNKVRKGNTQIQRIKYRGLRRYFEENNVSYAYFARKIGTSAGKIDTLSNFISDPSKGARFSIEQIKLMCQVTGQTFEQLFEIG